MIEGKFADPRGSSGSSAAWANLLLLSLALFWPTLGRAGDDDRFTHLLSERDANQLETTVPARESVHFSSESPWVCLAVGLDFPQDQGPALTSQRSYDGHGKLSLRAPVSFFDIEAKFRYGQLLGDRYPTDHGPDQKRNLRGDFLIGPAFSDLNPRWRFVPRLGVHYTTLNYFLSEQGQKNFLSPEVSLLWIYEQMSGGLFFMDMSYVHLDKGNFTGPKDNRFVYGMGVELGEIIPIGKKLGFLMSLEMEKSIIRDNNQNIHDQLNLLASVGLAF